jgi:hypothetical protein
MSPHYVMIAMLLLSCGTAAQEVAYINLVGITQRTALRQVPPKCPAGDSCVGGGFGGGIGGQCGTDAKSTQTARVRIVWADSVSYEDGEEGEWEATVENVGREDLHLPASMHLADLQPEDPSLAFRYVQMSLGPNVWIRSGTAHFENVTLYGFSGAPDSIIALKPGEWIRLRGRSKITLMSRHPVEGPLDAWLVFQKVTYTSSPERSGTVSAPACPNIKSKEGPVVRVLPASSQSTKTRN